METESAEYVKFNLSFLLSYRGKELRIINHFKFDLFQVFSVTEKHLKLTIFLAIFNFNLLSLLFEPSNVSASTFLSKHLS